VKPLNTLERAFINRFQGGFPLAERPFSQAAGQLGTRETKLIQTLEGLLRDGLLSRFGPLFDAERLGGAVTLAALSVPPGDYERVATEVNALPAVAHNYRREHRLNMWFVVASEQPSGIAAALAEIEARSGLPVYNFPRRQTFYLGLWLHLDDSGRVDTRPADATAATHTDWQGDALDRRLLRATQGGLPLCSDPWSALAGQLDCSGEQVLERLRAMLAAGVIRRVGAVPNHYRLGLRGNGMSVWNVPDDRAAQLGAEIGALDCVSHCYLRPRHAGVWPYNLFAMIHGGDRGTVLAKAKLIEQRLGPECLGHDILFSTAVLKKTGLRLAA
jgi:DNA-binding Lrp family transcriptional regulator